MPVVVKFHSMAAPSVVAWQQRLRAQHPGDATIVTVMRDLMIDWFRANNGLPPGAVLVAAPDPHYVARFTADTWVHFKVRLATDRRTREVFVTGLADSPP